MAWILRACFTLAISWELLVGYCCAQKESSIEEIPAYPEVHVRTPPSYLSPPQALPSPESEISRTVVEAPERLLELLPSTGFEATIPDGYQPWWQSTVLSPIRFSDASRSINSEELIFDALQYSSRIAAVNETVVIARTGITRAAAEFDPTQFVESRFIRTSVPTGSDLDAGFNVDRLREEDFSFSGGIRRRNQLGGQVEVGQQIGLRDSNSRFFTPDDQGNSRLTLNFTQPILAGAGKAFNRSLIVLAKLDTEISAQQSVAEIQDHLLAVSESAWDLYFQRTSLLLHLNHLQQARSILDWLTARRQVDALDSQIHRARSAVTSRESELSRGIASIRNAEDRIRALVNSPSLLTQRSMELVPDQAPTIERIDVSMDDAVVTALQQRSEINQLAFEIDSACVRLNVARNELLPSLDLIFETYVSGLRDGYDIGRSWVDQFSVGEPSYNAGFMFEVPLYRRAAKSNVQRRQAELRRLSKRLDETIQVLHAEVASAVRDLQTSYQEMHARYSAMQAATEYSGQLKERWKELPGEGFSANSILEDLLEAQNRQLAEEVAFVRAQIAYTLSITRLNRATGTLLQTDQPVWNHSPE